MPPMTPATAGAQYRVPPEPSRWPSIALAVVMHAALLGFLWIGISWQNTEPVAVTAEVWDMKVESAAAPLLPPPPAPEQKPEPEPEPKPVPKVIPPPPPPPIEQPVAPKAPDIALEREKRKAEQLKKDAEKRELIEQKKRDEAKTRDLAEKKKLEEDKKAKEADKKEADKKEALKKDAEKKEADKKKADKLAADKKADQLAKAKEAKEAAAEQAKLDKLRDAEMKRLMGAAGTTGSAAKSTAPRNDASYQAALTAKIKSTTTYAGSTDVSGNPRAEFRIEQLPTGEIISVRKVKSSGVPSFDDAVEKGIIKSSPLPKKKDGTVERSVLIGFSMKDLD